MSPGRHDEQAGAKKRCWNDSHFIPLSFLLLRHCENRPEVHVRESELPWA
jgi:hypothetical protein